ncbi:YciI family protein [Salinicola tamaricis]|uniref:YciI family protein n=1 Tax=Salinicola tamaricis TaxID=1771309 RepID=UPI001F5D88E3|nr:YciI family protein [Salinicola tamaricis]
MKQYAVVAYDYTDDDALERRLSNRDAHLAGVRELAKQGKFLSGGAILDDDGKMVGSTRTFASTTAPISTPGSRPSPT